MSTVFPFVEVPIELGEVLGRPDGGTRIYRRDGPEEEFAAWWEVVSAVAGRTMSPGGVNMYCPVSRAAVHKRIKEGRLTAFLFHPTERKTRLFGGEKVVRTSPYIAIPLCEVEAWRQELERRAVEEGRITQEELEGAKPDWLGTFLEWEKRQKRKGQT